MCVCVFVGGRGIEHEPPALNTNLYLCSTAETYFVCPWRWKCQVHLLSLEARRYHVFIFKNVLPETGASKGILTWDIFVLDFSLRCNFLDVCTQENNKEWWGQTSMLQAGFEPTISPFKRSRPAPQSGRWDRQKAVCYRESESCVY